MTTNNSSMNTTPEYMLLNRIREAGGPIHETAINHDESYDPRVYEEVDLHPSYVGWPQVEGPDHADVDLYNGAIRRDLLQRGYILNELYDKSGLGERPFVELSARKLSGRAGLKSKVVEVTGSSSIVYLRLWLAIHEL